MSIVAGVLPCKASAAPQIAILPGPSRSEAVSLRIVSMQCLLPTKVSLALEERSVAHVANLGKEAGRRVRRC